MKPFRLIFLFSFLVFFTFQIARAETGAVDVLISDQGLPKENFSFFIDNQKVTTDELGYVSLDLPKGAHSLQFKDQGQDKKISFQVEQSERTQLIVNIFSDQILHDLSEPVAKNIQTMDEKSEQGEVKLLVTSINGRPLPGVRVFAKGVVRSAVSNRKGEILLKLPVGVQVLSITHPKFSTQVVRDVKVRKDVLLNKTVQLTPAGLTLKDFVVLPPSMKGSIQALIEVRKNSKDVADVISAEQMAKSGDSDAAGSLKRVTGLTLKDGKYVYVRGMGERYSATLLNGVALPSPDPSRRVIPLDLFPVQFLDSIVIQKSFSSDLPGEFGGGVVMLKTKSLPEKFYFKTSLSQTMNSNSGDTFAYGAQSGTDWLGVDDRTRKLPSGVLNGEKDVSKAFASIPNNVERAENNPLPNLSFSVGDGWKFKALRLGYNVSALYRDNFNYTEKTRLRYREENGQLVNEDEVNQVRKLTQKEKVVGGIAGIQMSLFKSHKLNLDHINIRNTTDYIANTEGSEGRGQIRVFESEWAARTLKTFMAHGESGFSSLSNLKFNWHLAESKARRDEPRRVTARYSADTRQSGSYNLSGEDGAFLLRYYDLQEKAEDVGLSAGVDFPWFGGRQGRLVVGAGRTDKLRRSQMNRFQAQLTGPCENLSTSPGGVYNQCPDAFDEQNTTQNTDNYDASQKLQAYYFHSTWPLLSRLKLKTGMRYERSVQSVETIDPIANQNISTELTNKDWLPGSSLTFELSKKMQIRAAYNETVSRPDLRELSATRWEDFETAYEVRGNPNLRSAVLKGYDLRWEWYFRKKENVSVGAFYKEFDTPIEQIFSAGSDPGITFVNVEGARIYGLELEFSKNLGFMTSWLKRLSLSGNFSYLASNVELGDIQNSESTETNRPLQGQSNYIMNFLLDYEHEPYKLNASLAYNVYGKRIAYVAPEGLPNIWELPFHQLDFVISKKMSKSLRIQGKIRNLLNPKAQFVQGGQEWQGWRKGQSYTLGMAMEI